MSNFVSLDEAAKKLGVSNAELTEMISRGELFGYRDGASWKFKPEEIERVASEMMGDALDEDPAGSSILVSGSDSDAQNPADNTGSDIESDISLVPDSMDGSDVRLVANSSDDISLSKEEIDEDLSLSGEVDLSISDDDLALANSDDDDDELSLAADDGEELLAAASDAASSIGSDIELDEDELGLEPSADASNVLGGSDLSLAPESDLIQGDSDPSLGDDSIDLSASNADIDLTDDGDNLVLSGSDLALGSDSGINLMSPADSGISLEDEPLDLAASGISGLDLAAEGSDVGSDVGSGGGSGISGVGSGVDFQTEEEFQLSPSGAIETDDDSGSQVIELEDSTEFGDAAVAVPAEEGFDAFSDVEGGSLESEEEFEAAPAVGGAAVMASPEVPYTFGQVLLLLGLLLLMCPCGLLMTDLVRNLWAFAGSEDAITSSFTSMVVSAMGG